MEVIKWIIFILFCGIVLGLSLFLFCALKVASKSDEEEERRSHYTHTG